MADFRRMAIDLVSADGVIDEGEVRVLRKHLYEDGKITHDEVQFLIDLKKKTKTSTSAFDHFYLKAVGDSVLDNNIVSHEEIDLLKRIVADKKLNHGAVKKLLARIKKEAKPNPSYDKFQAAWLAKNS